MSFLPVVKSGQLFLKLKLRHKLFICSYEKARVLDCPYKFHLLCRNLMNIQHIYMYIYICIFSLDHAPRPGWFLVKMKMKIMMWNWILLHVKLDLFKCELGFVPMWNWTCFNMNLDLFQCEIWLDPIWN